MYIPKRDGQIEKSSMSLEDITLYLLIGDFGKSQNQIHP
jgi:hypothetical protein